MDYVRSCMYAIQRLDMGAMSGHHTPTKRDELSRPQKANRVHNIIQGTALGFAAVVVIIVLTVVFLVKTRLRSSTIKDCKDSEANCVIEPQTNSVPHKTMVQSHIRDPPYIGDRFPDGVIGGGQSPRVIAQPDYGNQNQNNDDELHEIDLGEAKQLY